MGRSLIRLVHDRGKTNELLDKGELRWSLIAQKIAKSKSGAGGSIPLEISVWCGGEKIAFLMIFRAVLCQYGISKTFACDAKDPSFLFTLSNTRQKRERSCMRAFETVSF